MYTWGYIKDAALAKLDLDQDEANEMRLINRFPFYANEVITQICSAIKPKHTFYEIKFYCKVVLVESGSYVDGDFVEGAFIDNDKRVIKDGKILYYPIGYVITMPSDFIAFGDDVCTRVYKDGCKSLVCEECHDDVLHYIGYDKFTCTKNGKYNISYKARWITFDNSTPTAEVLDVPADILECIPSYIAHQCYKIDDEYKSSVFRNEYEMFLARIDDTNFKTNKTFTIGGDW